MAITHAAQRKGKSIPVSESSLIPDTPENRVAWESFPRGMRPLERELLAGLERFSDDQLSEILLALTKKVMHKRSLGPKLKVDEKTAMP